MYTYYAPVAVANEGIQCGIPDEFKYFPSSRGRKFVQCDQDRLKPKPSYKAIFVLSFENFVLNGPPIL